MLFRSIVSAIAKSAVSVGEDTKIGNKLADKIEKVLFTKYAGRLPTVENIQRVVEEVLIKNNYNKIAKVYILYAEKRKEIINSKKFRDIKSEGLKLGLNSLRILQTRYLLKNDEGDVIETPIDLFRRSPRYYYARSHAIQS